MRVSALGLSALTLLGAFASRGFAATNQEELTAGCDELASKYFSREYGSRVSNNDYVDPETHKTLYDETRSTFTNHYDTKENRCLIDITIENTTRFETTQNSSTWIMLIDLTDNRDVGMFHASSSNPYADVCFIDQSSCNSREEWESFSKRYMQK